MSDRATKSGLEWQSKAILLIVVPWTVVSVVLQSRWWFQQAPVVAWTTLGISGVFGLIVWRMRAGTPAAAATGAAICASLMYSTTRFPYEYSWLHGGLMPLLAVFLLTFVATKIGKSKKEKLGTGEGKRGRNAAQVAANLGVAALCGSSGLILGWQGIGITPNPCAIVAICALAEAAADTVSSEIGQVLGGQPRMITTLRKAEPGTDGAISFAGTLAGIVAAAIVATVATACFYGGSPCRSNIAGCDVVYPTTTELSLMILLTTAGGSFGLLFDSLLGATAERKGWLNNDAVNFLSTLSAVVCMMLEIHCVLSQFRG